MNLQRKSWVINYFTQKEEKTGELAPKVALNKLKFRVSRHGRCLDQRKKNWYLNRLFLSVKAKQIMFHWKTTKCFGPSDFLCQFTLILYPKGFTECHSDTTFDKSVKLAKASNLSLNVVNPVFAYKITNLQTLFALAYQKEHPFLTPLMSEESSRLRVTTMRPFLV